MVLSACNAAGRVRPVGSRASLCAMQVNAAGSQLQSIRPAGDVATDLFRREVNNPRLTRAEAVHQAMVASMGLSIRKRVVSASYPCVSILGTLFNSCDGDSAQPSRQRVNYAREPSHGLSHRRPSVVRTGTRGFPQSAEFR
jgi:hypothetical protein